MRRKAEDIGSCVDAGRKYVERNLGVDLARFDEIQRRGAGGVHRATRSDYGSLRKGHTDGKGQKEKTGQDSQGHASGIQQTGRRGCWQIVNLL